MSKKNKHYPQTRFTPTDREVRVKENPNKTDHETPAWQFYRCDDHELWGWKKLNPEEKIDIIEKLGGFETMTWAEIKRQSAGKAAGRGTNHHPIPINGFAPDAKKRLREIKLEDIDELFSLRLGNTLRLYGVKEGRVLRFIWHDPHHGNSNGAYPTTK